jgi:hypothetical protein
MNIETTREFLGWCTVINFGLLTISSVMLILLQGPISKLHQAIFKLDEGAVRLSYFWFLAAYKLAIIVFNFVPYCALKIMSWWGTPTFWNKQSPLQATRCAILLQRPGFPRLAEGVRGCSLWHGVSLS